MFRRNTLFAAALAALVSGVLSSSPAHADVEDRLFDFKDSYYLRNGVNPAAISGRRQAVAPFGVTSTPPYSYQRNVRSLLTLPSYDHSGHTWFFTVLGGLSVNGFTNDAAGRNARIIADRSIEYVFPKRAADPFTLGQTRQSVILDMRNGYFSNNPLGLWIHVWVSYTDKALNTTSGKAALADLGRRNGLDADGTPIIRTISEIDWLSSNGLILKRFAALDSPIRYAICPVIKDPTDGGIAQDLFFSISKKADGSVVEPWFMREFTSLQRTGDWP